MLYDCNHDCESLYDSYANGEKKGGKRGSPRNHGNYSQRLYRKQTVRCHCH